VCVFCIRTHNKKAQCVCRQCGRVTVRTCALCYWSVFFRPSESYVLRVCSTTYYNEITNGCISFILCIYFLFLLLFTLHVSGSHKPVIRGITSCFLIYNHLVHVVCRSSAVLVDWSVMVVSH
jgi:hypothetical protein